MGLTDGEILTTGNAFMYSISILYLILVIIFFSYLTPLDEGLPRSEMLCLMSVPAKLTCVDLQQFTRPAK